MSLSLGPIMIGITGITLSDDDVRRLSHPMVGGVILFARNYSTPDQLKALTLAIKELRKPELLIAVDHEGGRVQRFREGFTRIPPMRELGNLWDSDPEAACAMARNAGIVIARELVSHGVDFSIAPVLDVDHGNASVIGNRAFHNQPGAVADLACALQSGLHEGGLATVGKHFPGHGYAHADSHVAVPVDERSYAQIESNDLVPFVRMVKDGMNAVMPAHVIYTQVDNCPAGFSSRWLKDILRGKMGFAGAIVSDDLGMAGASTAGGMVDRAEAALAAGCDLILSSNDDAAADKLLSELDCVGSTQGQLRLEQLRARRLDAHDGGLNAAAYLAARAEVIAFAQSYVSTESVAPPNDIVANL